MQTQLWPFCILLVYKCRNTWLMMAALLHSKCFIYVCIQLYAAFFHVGKQGYLWLYVRKLLGPLQNLRPITSNWLFCCCNWSFNNVFNKRFHALFLLFNKKINTPCTSMYSMAIYQLKSCLWSEITDKQTSLAQISSSLHKINIKVSV